MIVSVPVKNVSLIQTNQTEYVSTIRVISGEPESFTCVATNSTPAAKYKWYQGTTNITSDDDGAMEMVAFDNTTTAEDGDLTVVAFDNTTTADDGDVNVVAFDNTTTAGDGDVKVVTFYKADNGSDLKCIGWNHYTKFPFSESSITINVLCKYRGKLAVWYIYCAQ